MEKLGQISLRQAKILTAIVKEYCDTGEPVASRDLVEKYGFDLSPATVRSEMAELEALGLIHQPHTSAGRVPTDKGFRYFYNELMERVKLSIKEQDRLRHEMQKLQMVNAEVGRRLAKLLAAHSEQASFALFPEEISTVGLSKILEHPGLANEEAKEIAKFFDEIDEYAEGFIESYADHEPEALIGKELELSGMSDYSMIVSGVTLPSGKKGVVGLIGPKSMKYEKNLSLLEYISKLIGGGTLVLLSIHGGNLLIHYSN